VGSRVGEKGQVVVKGKDEAEELSGVFTHEIYRGKKPFSTFTNTGLLAKSWSCKPRVLALGKEIIKRQV